jgi:DNA-directed RNA polymerase subunit RPC12/RpoP
VVIKLDNNVIYKCTACGKSFTVTISNARYPGGKERESINCPWCGAENGSEVTSGIITTQKVDTEGGVNQ